MRLLLDTHAFVWWVLDDPQLSAASREAIAGAETVSVSLVAAWEIAIKVGQRKWAEARPVIDDFERITRRAELEILPIRVAHVRAAGIMSSQHRDPFDRLLVSQARIEAMTLVTADEKVQTMGADWLW